MPLNGINPTLQVETVLNGACLVGIIDGGIYVILQVIIAYRLLENLIGLFCKCHSFDCFVCKDTNNYVKNQIIKKDFVILQAI
jgi:hypothetical protein